VKRSVKQRRVQTELTGILRYSFGQVNFGKQLLSPCPGRAQALEIVP
jgi:hypothetical protein